MSEQERANEGLEADELGWVIERYRNSVLVYWDGRKVDESGWSTDHLEAVRFARDTDANVVLSWLLEGHGRVTQHAWVGRALSPREPRSPRVSADRDGGRG